MINIGLPKGVVKGKSLALIEKYSGNKIDKDTLNYECGNIRFILLKHRDIARFVNQGVLNYGITSMEWINELDAHVRVMKELEWCNTRVSLISKNNQTVLNKNKIKCISEFPNITKKYFEQFKDKSVTVDYISGSSEAFVSNLYDCCVDCVETGKTLRKNDLFEEGIILNSKMVFIQSMKCEESNKEVLDLLEKLND